MIKFHELKITPDNKHLIIDVSVEESSYYEDIILDSIVIDTHNTYVENGPSSKPVFTYNVTEEDDVNKKHTSLVIDLEDLNIPIRSTMFFVYVLTSGSYSPDTPCELRKTTEIGTVVNLYPLYTQAMMYTKEVANSCTIPKGFIDCILKIQALDLAIRTGNYIEAIRYWNKLFKSLSLKAIDSPSNYCVCHGENN